MTLFKGFFAGAGIYDWMAVTLLLLIAAFFLSLLALPFGVIAVMCRYMGWL
jgi:hypothetical protein